ncbi:NAD(P)H-dependent oxidoreductase [Microvirga antarctica]|uniref:NAD(P)H-dependent oxidoreductase n=1 Tax=Microvirga antarctica TaxID=2819233 RepID=UPI001B307BD1|nr:NAD(P)H-dependent oxidoreductase [Microvirga antarctica]
MKVFIVYAHPEPKSFNGAMKDRALLAFERAGHEVKISDLYEMKFKCTIDGDDFPARANPVQLQIPFEQEEAYHSGSTAADILAEQQKLIWADLILFQFPLWLYSQPAILKGWMERVFSSGFAHEVSARSDARRWFEKGGLRGRRALLSFTCAGAATAYEPTGRHGDINRILWPIHNALRYAGLDILPPFIAYSVLRGGDAARLEILDRFEAAMKNIEIAAPLGFHGLADYDDAHQLREGVVPMTAGQWRGSL